MSLGRFVRVPATIPELGSVVEPSAKAVHRRRSLRRGLVARSGACTPRVRQLLPTRRRPLLAIELTAHHDYGDGRHALEFETPALDMMLYHDRGATIAEWVTVDGRLVSLIAVGEC